MDNNYMILELINKRKENMKENRCCKYCAVKIDVRRVCNSCTMKINNFKLYDRNYFKEYYKLHKKPVLEPKKRGRKPKPKVIVEDEEDVEKEDVEKEENIINTI
jgi:hypothetical protein